MCIRDRVKDLRRVMEEKGLDGVNVTIPYKKAVIPLLDQLTPMARRVGAVNTIAWRDGRLVGHNTDAGGFMDMLAFAGIPAARQGFAVLGASGGAAQAVRAALEQAGARVYPVSRKGPVTYDSLPELDWQVLVNCTPLGMWPNTQAAPVELSLIHISPWGGIGGAQRIRDVGSATLLRLVAPPEVTAAHRLIAVSYTHLDVYKRQPRTGSI